MADFKLLFLFLIAIAFSLYLPVGASESIRLGVQSVFSPVTRFIIHSRTKTAGVFSLFDGYFAPLEQSQKVKLTTLTHSMQDKIIRLSDKVATLERKLAEVAEQNEKAFIQKFTPLGADVLGRNYQHFLDEITIDVGSDDGVRIGMGVILGGRVLGRIKAVAPTVATVAILVNTHCRIAARIERNQKQGLLEGGQATGLDIRCRMKYLFDGGKPGEEDAVKVGDRVLSSGTDPAFPAGLYIGQVSKVQKPEKDMFYKVEVSPAVDLLSIYSVVVLKPTESQK